ncbi:MAG: hypothetical protein KGH79_04120 [Patescibacteria group bacterium]|nr:hypothetical protein [Patescibacteria group bacterium]
MDSKKLGRALASALLTAFIVVSLFGVAQGIGMQTDSHGKMTGCMFSGTAICTMTPFEHLAAWQSMFTAIVSSQSVNMLALLLLAATVFAAFMATQLLFDAALDLLEARQRLYARRAFAAAHLNPLQELFSQGILNPKKH